MSKKHYTTSASGGARITAIIAVFLAILVGAYVTLSLVFGSWNPVKWTDRPTHGGNSNNTTTDNPNLDLSFEEGENNGISMLTALLPRSAYAANGVSERAQVAYNITATIYPTTAENKLVDWALQWADDGSNVTTHASLSIPSDGSLTVTLAVTQAFPDRNMKLICTSRDSGASGFALIRCEGLPTAITVEGSETTINNCRWGNSNTYSINLSNSLGFVGDAQYSKLSVKSVTLHGYIQYYDMVFYPNIFNSDISKIEASGQGSTYSEGGSRINLTEKYPNALKATISGRNLVLTMSAYPSATCTSTNVGSSVNGTTGTKVFGYNSAPKDAYAEVVLQSGSLVKTFRVDFVVGVTGVGLEDIVI